MVAGHTTSGGLVRSAPKNHRSKVALKKVLPKVNENPKTALFLKGEKCSQIVQDVMTDFYALKKPMAVRFSKKNEFRPFEEAKHLEFLSFKNDASLFAFGSHSKSKRPHNLIIGRHFDYQLLDMLELGVTKYESIRAEARVMVGSKPCFMFHGELFATNPTLGRVQNVILDFFRGRVVQQIQLLGLDHVIAVTLKPKDPSKEISVSEDGSSVTNAALLFRHYSIALKKSGDKVPRVELTNVGPSIDFEIRRCLFASPQMFRLACRTPKGMGVRKDKNITMDGLGEKYGQVHLAPQTKELATLGIRKFKAHKKVRKPVQDAAEGDDAADAPARKTAKRKRSSGAGMLGGSDEVGPSVLPSKKKAKTPGA
ncbi:Ribosome production factor 2-like protein [Diplonema papillatum]|nr:Ribosome production factor 2-like protein [Diplonema papillatum]